MAPSTEEAHNYSGMDNDKAVGKASPNHNTATEHQEDLFAAGEGDVNFRGVSWQGAAVLCAKFQIGLGIIGLPTTFDALGFFPGILCFCVLWTMSTFGGYLCGNARQYYPHMHNIGDAAHHLFGPVGREFIGTVYYIYVALTAGAGTLAVSVAFNALSEHGACTMAFAGAGAAATLVVGTGLRDLERVSWLGWVGVISTLIAIWTTAIACLTQSRPAAAPPGAPPPDVRAFANTTFAEAMAAIANQLFTVGGSSIFFSISAEMKHPEKFTRSLLYGHTFLLVVSLATSSIIYAKLGQYIASPALGSAGLLFKKICYGITLPGLIISAVLFSHAGAKYWFVKVLRGTRHLQSNTLVHWSIWSGAMLVTVAIGVIVIGLVPFFDDFLALIGAITNPILVLCTPGFMLLYFLARRPSKATERGVVHSEEVTGRHWFVDSLTVYKRGWRDALFMGIAWFMLVSGLFIIVGGTYGTVFIINEKYGDGKIGGVFQCADNS